MKKIRMHYQFYGRVQAVGFRYTAKQVADHFGLTGWVKNEYDGSVIAEIQGNEALVTDFGTYIERSSRWIEIMSTVKKEIPLQEDDREFSIEGY